jgi:GNAT superfamily N-acetyltransferase
VAPRAARKRSSEGAGDTYARVDRIGPPGLDVVRIWDANLDVAAALFDDYRAFYGRERDLAGARNFVAERSRDGATCFFLATLDGRGAGFAHLLPSFDTLAMRPAWILEDMFVAPAERRRGVGSALLRRAEEFARATGAAHLSLTTAHTNSNAQSLYEAHGYVRDDEFRAYHLRLE